MFGKNPVPVFIINGFLEAGKSTFINEAILSDPDVQKSKTLCLVCEEGEVEYKEAKNLTVIYVENKEDMTEEFLAGLKKKYNPDRVIIEFNGMWGMDTFFDLKIPAPWRYAEAMTIIDGSTFDTYYNNMRSIFTDMFKSSVSVMVNRCDREKTAFAEIRRNIRAVNPRIEVMFTDEKGMIDMIFEDELPYSLDDEVLELKNDNEYLIWYMDMMDNADRYKGKTVIFEGLAAKPKGFRPDYFVPGRQIMTCCEDDMSFLGYVCNWEGAKELKDYDKIKVTAKIDNRFCSEYGEKGPVLYAEKIERI